MVNFKITKKLKRKARRRRQKKEKKWMIFRIGACGSAIVCILSFFIGMFKVSITDYATFDTIAIVFSISLVIYVSFKALIKNLSSHWIQDRLNERIWIENGILYHFVQTAFAAGWNIRHADSTARIYEYHLSTIRNPKFDPKSGRIEFNVDGKLVFYRNYNKGIIEYERQLNGKPAVFYEYMEPSLYTYLANNGVKFSLETLEFKIRDHHV